MLAVPQDVALAAQRQVEGGQLEAVVGALHGGEARKRGLGLRRGHEVHFGRLLAAAHAPAQLMELREAEAVGVLHDHDRGVGHVHAHLDDGGGHEHLRLAAAEPIHDGLLLRGGHASVQKLHAVVGEHMGLQVGGLLRGGGHVVVCKVGIALDADGRVLVGFLVRLAPARPRRLRIALSPVLSDERAHHVRLLAARERGAGGVVGASAVVLAVDLRRAACRVVRSAREVGQREAAVERERERARDGRGREVERIGRLPLRQEPGALVHAEALLLVDHDEAEAALRDVVLQKRMRADEHVDLPRREAREDVFSLGIGRGADEHGPAHARRVEQRPEALPVLAGEHLGGGHEKRLRSRVRRRGQREGRHGGLARAHVSQKQVVRRARGGQRREDVVFGALLLVGQLEGQRPGQGRRARAVHDVAHRLAPPLALARLPHEHELEQKQLLVREAAARLGRLGHRLREMDARQRRPAAHEAVPRPQLERQRVAQARARRERVAHEPAHPRRRHLLACGMHGDDHALCRALAVERLEIGVRHALEAVAELELSRHGDAHAGL